MSDIEYPYKLVLTGRRYFGGTVITVPVSKQDAMEIKAMPEVDYRRVRDLIPGVHLDGTTGDMFKLNWVVSIREV